MKKFEYKQLFLNVNNNESIDHLNIFGNDGWELVSTIDVQSVF